MVGLAVTLHSILKDRSDTLTGGDIKHIVESIIMVESADIMHRTDKDKKEDMEKMLLLGKEYMYGGDE